MSSEFRKLGRWDESSLCRVFRCFEFRRTSNLCEDCQECRSFFIFFFERNLYSLRLEGIGSCMEGLWCKENPTTYGFGRRKGPFNWGENDLIVCYIGNVLVKSTAYKLEMLLQEALRNSSIRKAILKTPSTNSEMTVLPPS